MVMRFNDNPDDNVEIHEINVTPFIDVMLVLLIIFMVAAPLATVDVPVSLPTSTSKSQPRPQHPLYLSIKADEQLYVNNERVTADTLIASLDSQTAGEKETTIFFQADKTISYQMLMSVMDKLRQSGYLKIALMGLASESPTSR